MVQARQRQASIASKQITQNVIGPHQNVRIAVNPIFFFGILENPWFLLINYTKYLGA